MTITLLSRLTFSALVDACAKDFDGVRDRAIILLMIDSAWHLNRP